jgi:hypothetical protein
MSKNTEFKIEIKTLNGANFCNFENYQEHLKSSNFYGLNPT